jgi:hypothetical protein
MQFKKCTKCKKDQHLDFFSNNKGRKSSRCKSCVSEIKKCPDYKKRSNAIRRDRSLVIRDIECVICHNMFTTNIHNKITCSKVCKNKYRVIWNREMIEKKSSKEISLNCQVCEKVFVVGRRSFRKATCSKKCSSIKSAERIRFWNLEKKYNFSKDDFNTMMQKQDGKCAICEKDHSDAYNGLYVDHCHSAGLVRGLLCKECNVGIGFFKDNTKILKNAIKYIETHKEK